MKKRRDHLAITANQPPDLLEMTRLYEKEIEREFLMTETRQASDSEARPWPLFLIIGIVLILCSTLLALGLYFELSKGTLRFGGSDKKASELRTMQCWHSKKLLRKKMKVSVFEL